MAATAAGHAELVVFANSYPMVRAWAIEGTGGHGAGLTRHLLESLESPELVFELADASAPIGGLTVGESRIRSGEVVQRALHRLAGAHRVVQRHVVIGVDFTPVDPAVVIAVARAKQQRRPPPSASASPTRRTRYLAELNKRGPHPRKHCPRLPSGEAVVEGVRGRSGAGRDVQLGEDVAQVPRDRLLAQE